MVKTKNILSFGSTDTNKSCTLYENGIMRAIVMKLPNFTTATKVSQIDVLDNDGDTIYTNTNGGSGWAENVIYLISGLTIPLDKLYTLKITLDAASGGNHDVTMKTYIGGDLMLTDTFFELDANFDLMPKL